METKTKGTGQRVLLIVLAAVLAAGIAASCALGALAVSRMADQEEQIAQLSATVGSLIDMGSDRVTQEDDVKVAGEYMIRSTLPISEAYRTGDASALDDIQRETLDMASAVLDEIVTQDMTDYEKEKAVYDWMCAHLAHEGGVTVAIPTASQYSAQPYGVLKYGTAVCVGFATTFRLFMQMMGIDCMVVHNSYHSWDLVELDGEWYHTDVYSDVGRGDYANFNMTDGQCANGHEWDRTFYPAAEGLTYCYAYQNASVLDDVYQMPRLVREDLEGEDPKGLYFLLEGGKGQQLVLNELLGRLNDAVIQYGMQNGQDLSLNWDLQELDGKVLLSLSVYRYDEDPGETPSVSDEQLAQIDQAVQDAFGDVYSGELGIDEPLWDEVVDAAPGGAADWEVTGG